MEERDADRRRRKERGEALASSLVSDLAAEVLTKTCDVIVRRKLPELEEEAEGATSEAIGILARRLTQHWRSRQDGTERQPFGKLSRLAFSTEQTVRRLSIAPGQSFPICSLHLVCGPILLLLN